MTRRRARWGSAGRRRHIDAIALQVHDALATWGHDQGALPLGIDHHAQGIALLARIDERHLGSRRTPPARRRLPLTGEAII